MCSLSNRNWERHTATGSTRSGGLDAQNQYNLTVIEPSFATDPWYADNPSDAKLHYESFLIRDLVPWVTQNLEAPAGSQPFAPLAGGGQNWLIGFSKSGIGCADLLLKHPDMFAVAATWDFPADMSSYDAFGSSSASNYGTDANFQANYRLTPSFVDAHKAPFLNANRMWIGGFERLRDGYRRLRRAAHLRRHRTYDRDASADGPQVGQWMGPDRRGRAESGRRCSGLDALTQARRGVSEDLCSAHAPARAPLSDENGRRLGGSVR